MSGAAFKPCSCASCADQTDACNCGIKCTMVCQHKTVDPSLCGFQEYTSPSTPPKMYRRQTPSGSFTGCNMDTGCHTPGGGFSYSWHGSYQYDSSSCAETNGMVETFTGGVFTGSCSNGGSPVDSTPPKDFVPSNAGGAVPVVMPNSKTWSPSGCVGADTWSGTCTVILDDEDTEDDAEARASAADPFWAACSLCDASCTRYRIGTPRPPGTFTFTANLVQVQVAWTAIIGRSYKVTVKFYSRVLGSGGPFLFYGQTQITVVADMLSEVSPWIDVAYPGDGLEGLAGICTVEIIP